MQFFSLTAAGEIGAFPAVPFPLLIYEIAVLLFYTLRESIRTFDNNKFCAKCKSGA